MSLLGLDVGTTGCKAGVFSSGGQCLAMAYREYAARHPKDGWAELDSREVWARVQEVVAEVAARSAHDPVTALSVSAMGEAVTPVSRDREILGPCILSSDVRSGSGFNELLRFLGPKELFAITGNLPGVNYSLPKLLWLREHKPELYSRADRMLLWSDLVLYLLGGEPLIGYGQASRTLLFDVSGECWSERLLKLSEIEVSKLSTPVPSGTVAGRVSEHMGRKLGLPPGVKLVVGSHDQCCNALGAGIVAPGRAVCGIGTFECITPVYGRIPEPESMAQCGLNVEHHIVPGLYASFIYNQSGALVRWFRDTFARAEWQQAGPDVDIYDLLAREIPDEPTRLFTLPYFEITGTPGFVADASGVILGLKLGTTRGEILKSIMESVTLYLAEGVRALSFLGLETDEFVATGGGARSDPWLQIKADVFGVPFVRAAFTEGGVLGAALLAGVASGVFCNYAQATNAWVSRGKMFEPDARRHQIYVEKSEAFRQLFPLLRTFLSENEEREIKRRSRPRADEVRAKPAPRD
jgi:xylulokinase